MTIVQVAPGLLGRGDSLQIVIRGDGFDAGSTVEVQNDALAAGTIKVLATEFRSATELAVTVQVSRSAPEARYDVRVKSGRGRRGIGNERIGVLLVDLLGKGVALGVNGAGTVVGELSAGVGGTVPFVRFGAGDPILLPGPAATGAMSIGRATAINAGGVIVGRVGVIPSRWTNVTANGGSWEALVRWTEAPWAGSEGEAQAINDDGLIAGFVGRGDSLGGVMCWSAGSGARLTAVPWPTALGFVVGLTDDGDSFGDANVNTVRRGVRPFVVHCHQAQPTLEVLPLLPGMERGFVTAVAADGAVYGVNTDEAAGVSSRVLWTRSGPDRWQVAAFTSVGFDVTAATRGGRLIGQVNGGSFSRAMLWDPVAGLRELAALEASSSAKMAADRGPGSPVYVAGAIERFDGWRAAVWPEAIVP